MVEQTIPINVWLAGRSYRLRILPHQEELVRRSVKIADDKIIEFRNSYAGKDDQDFVAMCLLMYALETVVDKDFNPLVDAELKEMIAKIDAHLPR